jgi:hypothetical protein
MSKRISYKQHPIYSELVLIGRNERKINSNVLMGYEHLRDSPEVRRRAGADADAASRAAHAHAALLDAVALMVPLLKRQIAEAALGATPSYEGLLIGERWGKIAGVTERIFKGRRQEAFEDIVCYLTKPQLAGAPRQKGVRHQSTAGHWNGTPNYRTIYLTRLAQRAALLHYAGLASLFAINFTPLVLRSTVKGGQISGDSLSRCVFERYCEIAYSDEYGTKQQELLFAAVPRWLRVTLSQLLTELNGSTPAGPQTISGQLMQALTGLEVHHVVVSELYNAHWREWYDSQCVRVQSHRSPMCRVTALSGAVVDQIGKTITFTDAVDGPARLAALKALAIHYERLDDQAPFEGGLSLRQRAEAYFDLEGRALTDRAYYFHTSQ